MRLRIVDKAKVPKEPGDMWRMPDGDQPGRECWYLILPNGHPWYTTAHPSDDQSMMWEVIGDPPNITVSPSINQTLPEPGWHGHITNGEMTPA